MSTTAFEMFFPGGTVAQYDEVISNMGFVPGGTGAPGALSHWCAEVDGGLKVVDVWTSPELY